jgi:hypothetical protein
MPTFSTLYTIVKFGVNVAVQSGSYFYVIFPLEFDNFNNQPINYMLKVAGSILGSGFATVVDRTLEIYITTALGANT